MTSTPLPRRAVYTAVIGGYEKLNEQPVASRSDLSFVCFTDSPSLRSDTWQVQVVEPSMPSDPIRSARQLKIIGNPMLREFDETLWIDNSVVLRTPPEEILDEWLDGSDLTTPLHSFRAKLIDEFDVVVQAGLDDPTRVYEQLRHYLDERPDLLEAEPLWTAMLARRATPEVTDMCHRWFRDILRYSRRDQLSVLVALDRSPELRWRAVELDNYTSALHEWPVTAQRDRSGPRRNPLEALKPLAVRVRDLERSIEERTADQRQISSRLEACSEQGLGLLAAVNHREHELASLTGEVASLRDQAEGAMHRVAQMEASRSWRIGRAVTRVVRPSRWLQNPRP